MRRFLACFNFILAGIFCLGPTMALAQDYTFSTNTGPVACTAEARICPDGSWVGRHGPDCAFAACPEASPVEEISDGGEAGVAPGSGTDSNADEMPFKSNWDDSTSVSCRAAI